MSHRPLSASTESTPTRRPTTIVVIDPTDQRGEAGIEALHPSEIRVTLMLPLYGRWSRALQDYADAEEIDISSAGQLYLEQVSGRIDTQLYEVELVTIDGADLVRDIVDFERHAEIRRVILPSSIVRDRRLSVERLHARIPATLTITKPRPTKPYWDRRRTVRAA